MDVASILLLATVAGPYGVPVDGYPSHDERELLLWTNAARVAPESFSEAYQAGGCSSGDFSDDERTPKPPLYIDLDLTEASRYHSDTMAENNCFQHDSCDGSGESFDQRVAHYYDDTAYLGENIAMGGADERFSVLSMWMCSHDGHRASIMSSAYNEMGPGVSGSYMTQDFAAGNLEDGEPPVRIAVDADGTFWADWADPAAPEDLQLVVGGVETQLELRYGEAERGIYAASPDLDSGSCSDWYVWWETEAGDDGAFPEEGSWLSGAGCDADWTDERALRGGLFGDVDREDLEEAMLDDVTLVGCAAGSPRVGLWALGLALAALIRRSR